MPRRSDLMVSSYKEIVVVIGGEIRHGAGLAAEGFAVADLLQVVQSAGDALVAVRVEGVEAYAGAAVDAGVDLGA